MRDQFQNDNTEEFQLPLIRNQTKDGREYNLPSASEVAALIVDDLIVENYGRDS